MRRIVILVAGLAAAAAETAAHMQPYLSFVLRFDPGAKYPYHSHPAGEELYVLAGGCLIEGALLEAGDYLYTAPGEKHSVQTDSGCTLLFQVPEEVTIL